MALSKRFESSNYCWRFVDSLDGEYLGMVEVAKDRSHFLWSSTLGPGRSSMKMKWTAAGFGTEGVELAAATVDSGDYSAYCCLLDWISSNRGRLGATVDAAIEANLIIINGVTT